MKIVIALISIVIGAVIMSAPASAHVLITDTSNTKGAILHIIPDDDPVADEAATLYFDMQGDTTDTPKVALTITDTNGERAEVPVNVLETLATANYTFAMQGVYGLEYTVKTNGSTYTFEQQQRVSRGVMGSASDTPEYMWAQLLAVGSGVGLLVLAIVAFNRRKSIAAQSTL